MSLGQTLPYALGDAGSPRDRLRLAWVLAVVAVAIQVGIPLLDGAVLEKATVVSVLIFAVASVVHALVTRGARYTGVLLAVAGLGGLAVEAVGTRTGVPFGDYEYAGTLGPQLLGVPVIVPLAWVMMAHPCVLAGRRLGGSRLGWLPAAWLLASWDVFLDPQMVDAGHWVWSSAEPGLPGVPGIPLTNFVGWLLTAAVMCAVLVPASGHPRRSEDGPAALLLLWTYASQVLANLVFFDRPAVAAWGGLLMGAGVLPYAWQLRRRTS